MPKMRTSSEGGITFGNGEGGNPSGDQPFIRGMDAQASTFVDGMRDIAAGTREVFNLESVEVIKGADSAYAGRGGAGGSINLVTKKARNENFISGDVGLGTDSYRRATIDANRVLGESAVMIDTLQPRDGVVVVWTNHGVHSADEVYSGAELLDLEIPCGGGTYMALRWYKGESIPSLSMNQFELLDQKDPNAGKANVPITPDVVYT